MKAKLIPFSMIISLLFIFDLPSDGRSVKEMVIATKIDRVMVYQDRALITRRGMVNPENSGTCNMVFKDLPSLLQDGSVRAKVYNSRNVRILDVEVRSYKLTKSPDKKTRELQERLTQLNDNKIKISHRIQVLDLERSYLKDARDSFLGSWQKQKEGAAVQPRSLQIEDYEKMLNYLNKKHLSNRDDAFRFNARLHEVESKITVLKGELSKLYGGGSAIQNKKMVKVTLDIKKKQPFTVELSYINYRINWNPGYDIRVLTGAGKTEFTGYGIVSQSSGEDWNNAKVSYSTAKPAQRGWLPDLIPLYATTSSKVSRRAGGKGLRQSIQSQNAFNRSMLDNVSKDKENEKEDNDGILEDRATVKTQDKRTGTLVFNVPKRSSIPSDGSPHRTAISRHDFPVKFEYLSIPKLSPYAYLQALGKNTLETPILQGDLNIFMGNDFVGSSYTGNILPGEDFELMLGVNENIRVTRTLEEKHEKAAGFLGSSRDISYKFLIKIENYSGRNITMNVIDQIPVSETDEIILKDVSFSHKPAKKHKKGIVKWQFKMKSKETINLTFSFTAAVPKDRDLAFFRTKMPPSLYLQNKAVQRDEYDIREMKEKRKKAPALRQKMY